MRWRLAIVLLTLLALLGPGTAAGQDAPVSANPDFAAIDRYVDDQMSASRIPGVAIAVVEGDRIVHARGFGSAGGDRDVTPQTPFPIGSLIKSFTAVAVMQFVETGRVDLDAPVTDYLPEFQIGDGAASARITVRHLLNQTSGLSRETGIHPLYEQRATTLEEVVGDLRTAELNRPVGASYEYSNANFSTLALLVETVAGRPFGTYVNEQILTPLGMAHSSALDDETRAQMTAQYRYWFGRAVEVENPWQPTMFPGEYMIASVEDMARYLSMYLAGGRDLLSAAGVATLLTPATNQATRQLLSSEFTFRYGMGWFVGPFGAAQNAYWHLGELPYFNAWSVILPESNRAVVVMINAGSQMEFADANEVMSRLPIGVVNILNGAPPPTGIALTRFYVVFDTIVLVVLLIQLWALYRLLRRPDMRPLSVRGLRGALGTGRRVVPLVWELGLGLAVVMGYSALLGMSVTGGFLAFPDLTIVLLTVAALWLMSGIVRIARLGQAVASQRRASAVRSVPSPVPV